MIVKTESGQVFRGTPREIVHQLNITSHSPESSDREYMRQASQRMVLQAGHTLTEDSADKFIADLIADKRLIEVTEDEVS